jgi:hypothetical protein
MPPSLSAVGQLDSSLAHEASHEVTIYITKSNRECDGLGINDSLARSPLTDRIEKKIESSMTAFV